MIDKDCIDDVTGTRDNLMEVMEAVTWPPTVSAPSSWVSLKPFIDMPTQHMAGQKAQTVFKSL